MNKSDPKIRDKKSLPLSNLVTSFPLFLLFLLVVTPLWLVVLLPLTVLSQILIGAGKFAVSKDQTVDKKAKVKPDDPKELIKQIKKKASDVEDRIYDVVVFGASGFTGKMAAIYIAKQYNNTNVRWAIAGRRLNALKALRNELAQYNKNYATLPIIIADSFDEKSLDDMACQTKVVITTAGTYIYCMLKLILTHLTFLQGHSRSMVVDWSRVVYVSTISFSRPSRALTTRCLL
jgi:hypothetical protein